METQNLELFQDESSSFSPHLKRAIHDLANAGDEARGAYFTRREVVEFILDLVGYSVEQPLHTMRILEPSFGGGDFLIPIVERLLESFRKHSKRPGGKFKALASAIRGVELHRESFQSTRKKVADLLATSGVSPEDIEVILDAWLIHGDFLLADLEGDFSFVVGNPPYVRQELIPQVLMAEYRRRYVTIYDRADIYIPFIERSLSLLSFDGSLGLICADRWMKNRYGGPLRRLITEKYNLKFYVDMVDTPAFHSEVMAYPAITVMTRGSRSPTRIARRPAIDVASLSGLAKQLNTKRLSGKNIREIPPLVQGDSPWLFDGSNGLSLVRRLEEEFPSLEEAGCRVGIGVATGADKVFIGPMDTLDVEDNRKLPLVMPRDIQDGTVKWQGLGVLNPFTEEGNLVDLVQYPRFTAYLTKHEAVIRARHVARKNQRGWYRTIDRITPSLATTPKLLIPDIKGGAHIVYDEGKFYPHHNLYYITSTSWDLRALQAILQSGIARLFISTYSTKMRGGYLRFQAQYLRRIRLPRWESISISQRAGLIQAAVKGDLEACQRLSCEVFQLSEEEQASLEDPGK